MLRRDVDLRIEACLRCRTECCDCPEVVRMMDAKLDTLNDLRLSVPERPVTVDSRTFVR